MRSKAFVLLIFVSILISSTSFSQQNINYGETLIGSISTIGEVDTFSFQGLQGDKVTIQMTQINSYLDPFIELYDSTGSLIASATDGSQAIIEIELPIDGIYTLLASDNFSGNDIGDYSIFIQRTFNPGYADTIYYGQTTEAYLSTYGDIDTYMFSGDIGDKVIIRMTESQSGTSHYIEPFIELYGPNGDLITDHSDDKQAEISVTLNDVGDYAILASDNYPGDDYGNYTIFIENTADPGYVDTIYYGQTTEAYLFTYGDIDTYLFSGNIGDKVIIRMTESQSGTSHYIEPFIELYGPNGNLITDHSDDNQAEIYVTLNDVGDYTILASDNYPGDHFGNYTIFIENTSSPGYADTIYYGQTTEAYLSTYGDIDTYLFSGNIGDKVIIRMTESQSGTSHYIEPFIELYGPNGDLITDHSDDKQAEIPVTLNDVGDYAILASDNYPGDDYGNYSVYINSWHNILSNSDTISESNGIQSKTITHNGFVKAYVFLVDESDTTHFDITKLSGNLKPHIELYGLEDTLLAEYWNNNQVYINDYEFKKSGRYILFVGSNDDWGTGDYEISWSGVTTQLVEIVELLQPKGIIQKNQQIIPRMVVKNLSWGPELANLSINIYNTYSNTINGFVLSQNKIDTAEFIPWVPNEAAAYLVKCDAEVAAQIGSDHYKEKVVVSDGSLPEIHDRWPETGVNEGTTEITITGLGFDQNADVLLEQQNGSNIIADTIQYISSNEIKATFNLNNYLESVWNLKVINPNSDDYIFYEGFRIIEFAGQEIPFNSWQQFGVVSGTEILVGVNVPQNIDDLFVLVKKITKVGHHGTWIGGFKLYKNGILKQQKDGSDDLDLHIKDPESGWYDLTLWSNMVGEGLIKVCDHLDSLQLGTWHTGEVVRGWGNDWTQIDVPPGTDSLFFETQGFGVYSTLDIYYDLLGGLSNRWHFEKMGSGYQLDGCIPNPQTGTYYFKYLDSDNVVGGTSQSRDYLINVNTVDSIQPLPLVPEIYELSTYEGGTNGPVTVIIKGVGLDTAATVKLVRNGFSDKPAEFVVGDTTKRKLVAVFDLSNATPGGWNIKVENPDGGNMIDQDTFKIIAGGDVKIRLEILGRDNIRLGRWSKIVLVIHNSGIIDANEILVPVYLPKNCLWEFNIPFIVPPEFSNLVTSPSIELNDTLIVVPLSIPYLYASSTVSIELNIKTLIVQEIEKLRNLAIDLIFKATGGYHNYAAAQAAKDSEFSYLYYYALNGNQQFEEWKETDKNKFLNEYWTNYQNAYKLLPVPQLPTLEEILEEERINYLKGRLLPPLYQLLEAGVELSYGMFLSILNWLSNSGVSLFIPAEYKNDFVEFAELAKKRMEIVSSSTPEDKYGPNGFDKTETNTSNLKRFIQNDIVPYKIDFWNADSATAPAQEVFIIDTIDMNFNDSTLAFKKFGFLRWEVPLNGGQYCNTNVDMRPDMDLIVNVVGLYNPTNRVMTWTFRSLDPATMELPEDPMAGFLPPIDSSGYQLGWVEYEVLPLDNLTTGDTITNQAFVNFDGVGPWNPAPKEAPYLNTFDIGEPNSVILPNPIHIDSNAYKLSWTGNDDMLGSGITSYDIFVSEDKLGPYMPWRTFVSDTTAIFAGEYSKDYYFYTIAKDGVGNTEMPPDSFDVSLSYKVDYKVLLQGPYDQESGYMTSSLAEIDSFPIIQPYNTFPWNYSGSEYLNQAPSFVVDWILIELRSSPDTIVDRRAALLLNNGSIVDTNFLGPVQFANVSSGDYYVVIHHRNHMSVMSANPIMLHGENVVDFSDTLNTTFYGGNMSAQIELDSCVFGMIAGDVNQDGQLKYSGPGNDRNLILQRIVNESGSTSITTTVNGYYNEDLNMDSVVKYSGPDNDQSLIIQNIVRLTGSNSITNIYNSVVPIGILKTP